MKKIALITAVFMSLTYIAKAQDETDNREKFQMGAKLGGSYANVYDDKGDQFKADPKIGLTGGVFFMIPIGKYFGLHPEIMYTQKGFKGGGNLLGFRYDLARTSSFLDIPIFFELKPSEFITIMAGPQYSYLISQRDVFTSSAVSYTQEQEFKNDDIRKNIFGFAAGVDINLRHIVLGGRIGWDIQSNAANGSSFTPRYKNVCSQFTIGYKI